MPLLTSRRSFLAGLSALIAAPAIVRASNIMPVKLILPEKVAIIAPEDATFPITGSASFTGRVPFGNLYDPWTSARMEERDLSNYQNHFARNREYLAHFNAGQWQFTDHPHNNPAIVTLRDGSKLQRHKGIIT